MTFLGAMDKICSALKSYISDSIYSATKPIDTVIATGSYEYTINGYVSGGLDETSGSEIEDSTCVRTEYIKVSHSNITITGASALFNYTVYMYDANKIFSGTSDDYTTIEDPNEYIRIVAQSVDGTTPTEGYACNVYRTSVLQDLMSAVSELQTYAAGLEDRIETLEDRINSED